jgi:hypothetical protein
LLSSVALIALLIGLAVAAAADPPAAGSAGSAQPAHDEPTTEIDELADGFRTTVSELDTDDPFTKAIRRAPHAGAGLRLLQSWRLLDDLNLKLKGFTPSKSASGLGLSYDYNESVPAHYFQARGTSKTAADFALKASGNVAFDEADNPENFLDTKLKLRLVHSRGGVNVITSKLEESSETVSQSLDPPDSQLGFALLNMKEDEILGNPDQGIEGNPALRADFDEMMKSDEWAELAGAISEQLGTQYFYQVALDGGIESNQNFSEYQWTFGIQGGVEVEAWNPESAWAQLNLFDYPFAAIRYLSGEDREFTPDGLAIPSILFGYDRVMAQGNDPRALLGVDPDFNRLSGEVSFRALLARLRRTRIFFDANYRFYWEIDAPQGVRLADLDYFQYVQVALTSSQGFFFSYGYGQLPFDRQAQSVYQIGWKVNTDLLGGLLR